MSVWNSMFGFGAGNRAGNDARNELRNLSSTCIEPREGYSSRKYDAEWVPKQKELKDYRMLNVRADNFASFKVMVTEEAKNTMVNGKSWVFWVSWFGKLEYLKYLVEELKVDLKHQKYSLHAAAIGGHYAIASYLLNHGISKLYRDDRSRLAEEVAKDERTREIIIRYRNPLQSSGFSEYEMVSENVAEEYDNELDRLRNENQDLKQQVEKYKLLMNEHRKIISKMNEQFQSFVSNFGAVRKESEFLISSCAPPSISSLSSSNSSFGSISSSNGMSGGAKLSESGTNRSVRKKFSLNDSVIEEHF